ALAALATGRLLSTPATAEPQKPDPKEDGPFLFYAKDTGLRGPDVPTLDKKAQLLRKLGFRSIGYTLNHRGLPKLLELLDGAGLELSAVYTTPALEAEPDPGLPASVRLLKGRPTRIKLAVTSKKHRPSDLEGDRAGIELLRRVSDLAGDTGPVASVYPHR